MLNFVCARTNPGKKITTINMSSYEYMDLFFSLIQVSLGRRDSLPLAPSRNQWADMFDAAVRQSLIGVCGSGVERLPEEQRPPRDIAVKWAFFVNSIEERNRWMNVKCGEITELMAADGFSSCVLKGQGMATLYPNPLRRQSGDIDLLCWPKDAGPKDCGMKEVVAYVRLHDRKGQVVYHHAEMHTAFCRTADGCVSFVPTGGVDDIEIEVHYRPSWFYSPLRNRCFQRWALRHRSEMRFAPDGGFFFPQPSYNALYILVHIYRHLFDEGIGLRQLLDYYYVLKEIRHDTVAVESLRMMLRKLGMMKFARAVMYVLREVFGMEESDMPVEVDVREGRFLLSEIIQAGNFGQYDERSQARQGESLIARFTRRQKRVSRFLIHYPEETVCAPLWTLWQRMWRRKNGYIVSK